MGKIFLEGMEFYARHGCYKEERIIGHKFSVDVILDVDFSGAVLNDRLEGTVNYEKIYKIVQEIMRIDANLLEHLAGKMIKMIKEKFLKVNKVHVRISKYNPAIKGLCCRAIVELEG